ncbi:MAG: ABC transporter ATP-binding protein [Dehalococcoidia bacterium]|nr:ABC transporter ATP-binding protein [Dehalococcoidia bacterium]
MAVDDISLEVPRGSVVSILGANGAGKSTIMRAICGLVTLTSGEIWFEDKRIDHMETQDIVKLGLIQVPEGRKLFPYLSVLDNLKLGASLRKDKAAIKQDMDEIFQRFPRLKERYTQKAATLSGGEQQMLAIARGLMASPKLLMLDEPSVGLAPIMVDNIGDIIADINARGVTILLVEQNIPLALRVAKRGYALQVGKIVLEGDIEKFQSTEAIKQAYLGGSSGFK